MSTAAGHGALERFLRERGLVDGPVTVRPIGDGHSNLTYLVSDGTRAVVVRRPPPPPTPPGAHDVLREALFIGALAGSGVPVPGVLATAAAGEVFDVPCYVMTFVDGPVVTTATPGPLSAAATRREVGESMADTLAALHAVDRERAGLGEAGRPEGFNARHLRRMRRLVAGSDGVLPDDFAELGSWLERHVPPESGAAIVHNDFRLGNLVLAPSTPGRVAAVLDWELATIGDPLLDVAYLLASYPQPGDPLVPTAEMATAVLEEGWPTRDELAGRYATATGRDLSGLGWYTVMVLWKLAVLYEYSRRRGADPYYADPALVRSFLDAAHHAAELAT